MTLIYDPESLGLKVSTIAGNEAMVFCPFHSDSNPSAEFNLVEGLFYCFGCHESTNAKGLASELGGEIVMIESSSLKHFKGKERPEWRNLLLHNLAIDNEYLISRGVPNYLVEAHDIRANDDGILFPLKWRGRTTGIIMRRYESGSHKYIFYGERPPLWPYENLHGFIGETKRRTYIVEGVFGVLRAQLAGINAVAIMGSSSIRKAVGILDGIGDDVYVFFDPDEAGWLGAAKMVALGFKAIVPEACADEIDVPTWRRLDKHREKFTTRTINPFLDRTRDRKKMLRLIDNMIWKEDGNTWKRK